MAFGTKVLPQGDPTTATSRIPAPSNPLKRRALKSRLGCRTCKFRKVKCDEVRPLCGNCARRSLFIDKCDFEFDLPPATQNTAQTSNKPPARSQLQSLSPVPPTLAFRPICTRATPAAQSLELRLLDHYTHSASKDLFDRSDIRMREIFDVSALRFSNYVDFTQSITLALAAYHYSCQVPDDLTLAPASDHYFTQAITQYRNALTEITTGNAEPLLVTSVLLAHHTWLISLDQAASGNFWPALHAFYLCQGVQLLYFNVKPYLELETSKYAWFYTDDRIIILESVVAHRTFWQSCKSDLQQLLAAAEIANPKNVWIYANTMVHLKAIYFMMLISDSPYSVHREVATAVLKTPREFVDLLLEGDPPALVLAARYFALFRVVDFIWWLHGKGGQEIGESIVSYIGERIPAEWQWAMEWPLKFMEGSIRPETP